MKQRIGQAALVALLMWAPVATVEAAEEEEAPRAVVSTEVLQARATEVFENIKTLAQADITDSEAYAVLFKELDTLHDLADPTDIDLRTRVISVKGIVYQFILKDSVSARKEFERLIAEFPGTEPAREAEAMIADIKLQASLAPGAEFPPFSFVDLEGETISLADYRGKVVLVDFWATWCPPCVADMPKLLAAYREYHDKGFEIIGISLDQDKDKLEAFMKKNEMAWPQYFDGKGWKNELSNKYSVRSIPATFLLDREGRILGRDFRQSELEEALEKVFE